MMVPFDAEAFFGVFVAYNTAVWPMQWVLTLVAVVAVVGAARTPAAHRTVAAVLAGLWLWMGVVYHGIFFTAINPAAPAFGALFVVQAVLFAWFGLVRETLHIRLPVNGVGAVGGLLITYALVVYPLLGFALGQRYPAQPTFGLPCPTVIFTLGILLWTRPPVPWQLLPIPLLWSAVGASAAWWFGVWEDAMLPVAGLVVALLVLARNRLSHDAVHL